MDQGTALATARAVPRPILNPAMVLGSLPGEDRVASDAATRHVPGANTRRGVASPRVSKTSTAGRNPHGVKLQECV